MDEGRLRIEIAKVKGWTFWEMDEGQGYDGYRYAVEPGDFPDPQGYGYKLHQIEGERVDFGAFDDGSNSFWPFDIRSAWQLVDEIEAAGLRWMMYTWADGSKDFAIYEPEALEGMEGMERWKLLAEERGKTAAIAISQTYLIWKRGSDAKPES